MSAAPILLFTGALLLAMMFEELYAIIILQKYPAPKGFAVIAYWISIGLIGLHIDAFDKGGMTAIACVGISHVILTFIHCA